jgi:hypothetical protein
VNIKPPMLSVSSISSHVGHRPFEMGGAGGLSAQTKDELGVFAPTVNNNV